MDALLQFEEHFTERLMLRTLLVPHFKRLLGQYSDEQLTNILGCRDQEQYSSLKDRIWVYGLQGARLGMHNWLLYRRSDGKLIGDVSYHIIYKRHRRAELGYGLYDAEDRGQGYMQEVLPYVLAYGFEQLKLERIEALTAPDNIASMSLLIRYGFKREGYARRHYRVGEKNTDSFSFALLKEELRENRLGNNPLEKLVRSFEQQALPPDMWNHEAHLKTALWYVYHEGEAAALAKLRVGLITFLNGVGKQSTLTGGYHETLTVFWVKRLRQFVEEHPGLPFADLLEKLLASELASPDYVKQYYQEGVLQSVRARAAWVLPDVKPIGLKER